jgi:hypothetical protein
VRSPIRLSRNSPSPNITSHCWPRFWQRCVMSNFAGRLFLLFGQTSRMARQDGRIDARNPSSGCCTWSVYARNGASIAYTTGGDNSRVPGQHGGLSRQVVKPMEALPGGFIAESRKHFHR